MVRWLTVMCIVLLAGGGIAALRPDPWAAADAKATMDVEHIHQSLHSADRISWQLSQDSALLHVVVWGEEGRLYPPPTGMTPFPYELSEDSVNRLARIRETSAAPVWDLFDATTDKLLYCRSAPDTCLIYDRRQLVQTLDLPSGALLAPNRTFSMSLILLGCGLMAGALALLRWRGVSRNNAAAEAATFRLLPERHLAMRGSLEVPLTPRDLKLLALLSERRGDVVTKDELYDRAWGRDYMPNSRALDQHMITLRRKLDPDKTLPVLIETVRGVGYRLLL